jgi:hypothetical protein
MEPKPTNDIDRLFEVGTEIDQAVARAARKARESHRRAGLPLPVWRDGRTVWVAAEELENPSEEATFKETD